MLSIGLSDIHYAPYTSYGMNEDNTLKNYIVMIPAGIVHSDSILYLKRIEQGADYPAGQASPLNEVKIRK